MQLWQKNPEPVGIYHTITFRNVDNPIPTETVKDGELGVEPKIPTKSGYTFTGWYTDQEATTDLFNWSTLITKDYTLYAGWTETAEALTFTATSDCVFYVGHYGHEGATREANLSYSVNGGEWIEYTMPPINEEGDQISIGSGQVIKFRGNNPNGFNYWDDDSESYYSFYFDNDGNPCGKISGNVMSLMSYDFMNWDGTFPCDGCFECLFYDCSGVSSASELILPANQLTPQCYSYMFANCSSLTTVPEQLLPTQTLVEHCYEGMFMGCTSLTTAPVLSAETLAPYCYYEMFNGCTSLTTPPELNTLTLADAENCYNGMFCDCTSLTTAPNLPATTLAEGCYEYMFLVVRL